MRILAHRGLPGPARQENTVAAVAAALAAGADGVEVDLRLTADGVLAVSHDPGLARLTGSAVQVADTPWAVLREAAARGGTALARVEEVLALTAERTVVLELKEPPGSLEPTAAAVVDLLRERGPHADLVLSSFSPALLAAVRERLPASLGARTALLGDRCDPVAGLLRCALDAGHDQVHPHVGALLEQPHLLAAAHAVGVGVVPWTVNRRRDLRRLHRLGVDGVITDVPVTARATTTVTPAAA